MTGLIAVPIALWLFAPSPEPSASAPFPDCSPAGESVLQARRLYLSGHFAESRLALAELLRASEERESPDPAVRACLMSMIGVADRQQGRPAEAASWFEKGLALKPLPLPLAALITGNLAAARLDMHQLDKAEQAARLAMALTERAYGSGNPETLFVLATLAGVHFARGDLDRAEPVLRRIVHDSEKRWSAASYEVALASANLGALYLAQRKFTNAEASFQRALNGLRQIPHRARGDMALAEIGIAAAYAETGRTPQAQAAFDQAVETAGHDLTPHDPAMATFLERAAAIQFRLENPESGCELFEKALDVLESNFGPASDDVLAAMDRYSRLLRQAKDKTRARRLQLRAQRYKTLRPQ